MIRVLQLIPRYRGNYPLLNLQLCLDPRRFRSTVCYVGGAPDGANGAEQRAARVTYLRRPEGGVRWYNPRVICALVRQLDADQADVLCCQPGSAAPFGVVAAALSRRRPAVVTVVHGCADTTRRRALLMRLLRRRLDLVVAVGDAVAADVTARWRLRPGQVAVIRNGLDYAPFLHGAAGEGADREAARAALVPGAPPGFWVGTVGRLQPVKNQETLIRAFAAFAGDGERLLIAGRGPDEARLRGLAAALGVGCRVVFLGHRRDVALVLRALDVFVLPSRREGLPLALLEALAAALPVIAARVPGVVDVVGADDAAQLFSAGDVAGLTQALHAVHALGPAGRRAMGERGRRRALAEFPAERMIRGYEDAFAQVVARRAAGVRPGRSRAADAALKEDACRAAS